MSFDIQMIAGEKLNIGEYKLFEPWYYGQTFRRET